MNNNNTFLALISRMKYINRWGLLPTLQTETLSQHSFECAVVAHFLSSIGNSFFNTNYNISNIIICALYHDVSEIFTGDIATPVKHYNDTTSENFNHLESISTQNIIDSLPTVFKSSYASYIKQSILTIEEKKLIKVSDKICAYIKCISEYKMGNNEFKTIEKTILNEIKLLNSPEANYFIENCIDSFNLPLQELTE